MGPAERLAKSTAAAAVLALSAHSATPAQQLNVAPSVQITKAEAFLRAGQTDSAYIFFSWALNGAEQRGDSTALVESYLGLALLRNEWVDSLAEARDYDRFSLTMSLDTGTEYTAAVVQFVNLASETGRYAAAASLLDDVALVESPGRSYYQLDAGQAYLQADEPELAMDRFQRALQTDPNNVAAVAALIEVALDQGDYGRVLLASRLSRTAESSTRAYANRNLLELLRQDGPTLDEYDAALLLLGTTLADLGTGPTEFDRNYRLELSRAGRHPGADELLLGYAGAPTSTGAPPWWNDTSARNKVWHRLMRRLGDWYAIRENMDQARRYYEAALGYPQTEIFDRTVDVEALVPLASIYAELPAFEFDRFSDWLFSEKQLAYHILRSERPDAVPILRRLHMSLGLMFARQYQWGNSPFDPYGAAFQLQRMWDFTERMRDEGVDIDAPPELLEQLAYANFALDRTAEARRASEAAMHGYLERGSDVDADRFGQILADPAMIEQAITPP